MKKKTPKNESISTGFARKYIFYYYAIFWIILILTLIFK